MELNDVLRKVRALVATAEHENTSPAEADAAREAADKLMLKFAIDEAALDASRPVEERGGPETIEVDLDGTGTGLIGHFTWLVDVVAHHCRSRVRAYSRYDRENRVWMAKVYGFKSDLRYFEIMYTTLRLHMASALSQKWDDDAPYDANIYRLHNAGFNWADLARMRGWIKEHSRYYPDIKNPYRAPFTSEVIPSTKMGASFKAAYMRECKRLGSEPVQIPAGGSKTYRRSAASGYVSRISQRLIMVEKGRDKAETGGLVLRRDDLDAFFRDQNPDLFPEQEYDGLKTRKYVPPPFNYGAYSAGSRHADTADLGSNLSKPATGQLREKCN